MQPSDVTAYGCDYSEQEYTPQQLDLYPGVRIEWISRYIGYPGNPKCISHYPGAYRAHRDYGRPVVLFHQIAYRDFEGGASSGRAHAQTALADARGQGWDGETPIIAAFDRRMPAFTRGGVTYRAIWLDEVRDYMKGFVSVLGHDTAGFYGFEDTMKPCVDENWVRFRMQCGARSAHIPGISAWQENNEQPYLLGGQTDRLELYIPLSDIGGDDMSWSERRKNPEGYEDEMGNFLTAAEFKINEFTKPFTVVGADYTSDARTEMANLPNNFKRVYAKQDAILAAVQGKTPEEIDKIIDASVKRHTPTAAQIATELDKTLVPKMKEFAELVRDTDNLDEAKQTARELVLLISSAVPTQPSAADTEA